MPPVEREGPERQLYETSAVAKELGLTRSGLNRLALIYERVHGELPRGERHVRLWTPEAIDYLRSARLAVQEGRAVTMEAALRGVEVAGGAQSSTELSKRSEVRLRTGPLSSSLDALMEELHSLREVVEEQNKLLRNQAYRLKRLETTLSPLPDANVRLPERNSVEGPDSPESRTEKPNEGKDAARGAREERGAFWLIIPTVVVIISIAITLISTLYKNTLMFTAGLGVIAILFFGWYYYAKASSSAKANTPPEDPLANPAAQADEQRKSQEKL
jgi:hypothetical protein